MSKTTFRWERPRLLKLRQVAENLADILSIELFCAAQGIDFRRKEIGRDKKLGVGTRGIYEEVRSRIPFIEHDVYMKEHLDSAAEVVADFILP